MSFATGLRPDPASTLARHRFLGARPLASRLGAGAPPAAANLLPYYPHVMDQAATGSCVAHAVSAGAYAALAAVGKPIPWVPSQADLYRLGRALERAQEGLPVLTALVDGGSRPSDVLLIATAWGMKPMVSFSSRFSDADPATINNEPTLDDVEADSTSVLVTSHPITSNGDQLLTDLKVALASKCPVTISVPGGFAAFQRYTGGVLGPVDLGQNPLDHCVSLAKYETGADGSTIWTLRNSWSDAWGDGGNIRVSTDFILQSTGDTFAIASR